MFAIIDHNKPLRTCAISLHPSSTILLFHQIHCLGCLFIRLISQLVSLYEIKHEKMGKSSLLRISPPRETEPQSKVTRNRFPLVIPANQKLVFASHVTRQFLPQMIVIILASFR